MTPAGIMVALAEHGARIVVDGDRVRLIYSPGIRPPADLVEAAREQKAALRVLVGSPASGQTGAVDWNTLLPAHVAVGLDQLAAKLPLLDDWSRRIEAAREMAARWDAQGRRLGWTDADLYGLHPLAPAIRRDAKGLAWCLDRGDRVTAITDSCAIIETAGGNRLRFYRAQQDTGAVVAWQLATAGGEQ